MIYCFFNELNKQINDNNLAYDLSTREIAKICFN